MNVAADSPGLSGTGSVSQAIDERPALARAIRADVEFGYG
jgi:hypothetical protein